MKKIINSTWLFLAILISSCTHLESEMYDIITLGIFPKTEADAQALVTGQVYAPFRGGAWGEGLFNVGASGLFVCTDMTTDQGDCQWNAAVWPDLVTVNFRSTSPGNGPTQFYGYLRDISKMTITIENINSSSISDAVKKRLIAETRCARGWLAYILYDLYGGVPIASPEQLIDPSVDVALPRLMGKDIVEYIEGELKAAIESKELKDNYQKGDIGYGRFTNGLAYTVLMKLYMLEKDWAKAEATGRELMNPKYGYGLMDNYQSIFTLENEKNKEVIWAAVADRKTVPSMWQAHVLSSGYPTKNPNIQKWGGYRVPWAFYNKFDKTDKRLEVLVGEYTDENSGKIVNQKNPGTTLFKGAMPVKYGEDPDSPGWQSQLDWIVYRYADVVTLLSEAIVRKNNAVTQEAIDLLNMVHTRAGLSAYKLTDLSDPLVFLDELLLERGKEFWFEGVRRTDLIRHGKYIEYAKAKGSATAAPHMVLMPLPQWAVDEAAKSGLDIQNPGY